MLLVALAAAAAEIGTVFIKAPYAPPEAIFSGRSAEEVSGALASGCMDLRSVGWSVVEQTDRQVTCERASFSGQPFSASHFRRMVRFSLVTVNGSVRVQSTPYTIETRPFIGPVETNESGPDVSVQDFLIGVGGQYAPGTQFEGSDFGIRGHLEISGRSRTFVISRLDIDGPAQTAGLAPGDRITALNGKKLPWENDDLRWFFGKVKPGQSAMIAFERGSQPMQVTITARIKPTP